MIKPIQLLILLITLSSCATLKDQAKSGELLGKCKYSLDNIAVENIAFDKLIQLAAMAKEIDFKNPGSEVLPLLNEIRKMNFDVDFSELDIKATIGIENPNPLPVVLDSIAFDAFLDGNEVVHVTSAGSNVNVPANGKGQVDAIMTMPTTYKLKKLLAAESINLKGKAWLKIELIKGFPVTVPFKFDVDRKIPREEIQTLIDAQKEKIVEALVKKLLKGNALDFLKKL